MALVGGLDEGRVLVVAPTQRDASITKKLLNEAMIECFICESMEVLISEVQRAAGAVLITDDELILSGFERLAQVLKEQPSWSELPVIMLSHSRGDGDELSSNLRHLSNVTVVERPAPLRSVLSAVQAGLRARQRQYQIRDQITQIAQAADQFKVLANAIPQLAWMADETGSIFWYNRRWYEYTGTSFADVAGWAWESVHDPEMLPEVKARWTEALATGTPFEMEFPLRGADGQFRHFLTQAQPIFDEGGKVIRWLGTNTDIDELRRLREAREQMLESERAARMEAERAARLKDEFLATLSHELRTPLSAILGWAYIMKVRPDDPKTISDGVQVIERSGEALKYLVEDLLELSRIASGKMRLNITEISAEGVVAAAIDSVETAAAQKGVEIRRFLSSMPRKIPADAGRLQQILWNLLSNAIKFTPSGGLIVVTLKGRGRQGDHHGEGQR